MLHQFQFNKVHSWLHRTMQSDRIQSIKQPVNTCLTWSSAIKWYQPYFSCSYSTTNKMHLLPQIIYSRKTHCMFRTVFPSIIRSSKLHVQQRCMSNSCCYQGWDGTEFHLIPDSSSCLTYTVAVHEVLSSWWWMERPSETRRAFYENR
jgi:hypothetical protein